ncbi:hypothetical protein NB231_06456 [Nitrococcus mobilis Nb-231]|uniref:Uncharacterized protein n=2 Tax=Nitrococcus mobilis TaxID=35797 RepID=A4BR08_9GAMM|nr:hypothetical protein NB231_06456 [Nitrococcus mobilis Nb-231]
MLVGPWYRWLQPGIPAAGRFSRPIFQKYAASDFVSRFLEEPQRSLIYRDEDFVHEVRANGASVYSLSKKSYVKAQPELRKLFLDVHSRFYLVACELHCDAPGFPSVKREAVCEAGFVIRRRIVRVAPEARQELAEVQRQIAAARARIAKLRGASSFGGRLGRSFNGVCQDKLAKLQEEVKAGQRRLKELRRAEQIRYALEGWVPSQKSADLGAWRAIETEPQIVTEAILPLYPLIPAESDTHHSAHKRSIWFGVVPTSGAATDEGGQPRFDERSVYQVHCFVRRHNPACPKTSARSDCKGELVWSTPTERYQLAAHFDLEGTSNRTVTVQLPDLNALEAQADSLRPGQAAGVRMVSPPGSSLDFKVDGDNTPTLADPKRPRGGASICFFAIPLITIVAMFVLQLFLPIVVSLFQLWFLLLLKFCIPPAFSIDAGLAAAMELEGPELDIEASVQAKIDAQGVLNIGGHTISSVEEFKELLKSKFDEKGDHLHPEVRQGLIDAFGDDLNALGKLALDMATDFSADAPPGLREALEEPDPATAAVKGRLPSVTDKLVYYQRVEPPNL